jgi:hypothetical protein
MGCEPIEINGFKGHACSRGRKSRPRCKTCRRPARYFCDYPVTRKGVAGTCDRACCARHRKHVGPDRDYCEPHALKSAQGELFP